MGDQHITGDGENSIYFIENTSCFPQDTLLNVIGVPVVHEISAYLLTNPNASTAIEGLSKDPLTTTYVGALTALANVLGPLEQTLLVSCAASSSLILTMSEGSTESLWPSMHVLEFLEDISCIVML